jgi:ATP-binding cassette subfamily B multidrug efflux pump
MRPYQPTPVMHPEKMSSYWKKEWKVILAVVVTGVFTNGAMSYGPILLGVLIDAIAAGEGQSAVVSRTLLYLGVIALIQLTRVLKRYYVRVFANRTSATMRLMIYNSILHADTAQLSSQQTGDLMNKAVGDVDICTEGMRKVTTEVFDTGVLMAGYLIALLGYDWKMTLAACAFIPVSMLLAGRMKKTVVRLGRAERAQSSRVADMTYGLTSHMLLYRINGLANREDAEYDRQLGLLEKAGIRSDVMENCLQPVYNAISMFGTAVVFYFGVSRVLAGTWSVGTFTAYLSIFAAFALKSSKAAKLFNSYQKAKVSWERIREYFREYLPYPAAEKKPAVQEYAVRDLSFAWTDSRPLIRGFSFTAHAGEIIGVTGPVACGKSTLGIALSGMEGYEGSITCNGRELKDCTALERSDRISYMGHDPMLLDDTIENNILLGQKGDVMPVLADVDFLSDLKEMKDGIHTLVGSSGVRLSGGQQARIALARALFHHAGVLILDDPFASVDRRTEFNIYRNLREHYSGCILFIISHRLDLFDQFDRILLMHADGSIETGTPEAMKQEEEYGTLYALQEAEAHE